MLINGMNIRQQCNNDEAVAQGSWIKDWVSRECVNNKQTVWLKWWRFFEWQNVEYICYIKDLCSMFQLWLRWMARWKGKWGFEAKVKEKDKKKERENIKKGNGRTRWECGACKNDTCGHSWTRKKRKRKFRLGAPVRFSRRQSPQQRIRQSMCRLKRWVAHYQR